MSSASFASSVVESASHRLGIFLVVGWLGFALQLVALALLMSIAHWSWLPATVVAVELAVIHNFVWHERVTWRDRQGQGFARLARLVRFARFNIATGITSIAGNVVLMAFFLGALDISPVMANAMAVGTMSLVNFFFADRWVFRKAVVTPRGATSVSSVASGVAILAAVLTVSTSTDASAAPRPETIAAWNRYVAETEKTLEASCSSPRSADREMRTEGESIGVPSGTISRWRGSIFVPGVDLDRVLNRLQHPGTPPPQEDIVSSRVLARGEDSLRVFIRLVRHAIVTVTYDTEHEMTFHRRTPTIATARSVATRIDEVGGGDRGFLWRLHSYWRYEQVAGGVRIDLESLTLSRDVPALVRPIASPLVSRIARESMVRTLEALQQFLDPKSGNNLTR